MCKWGTDANVTLAYPMPVSGRTVIAVDACLAPLIQALNDYGVHTVGCCCGHDKGPGVVLYEQDGQQVELRTSSPPRGSTTKRIRANMSANLYWSPIRKGKDLPVNAPSSFMEAMDRALGRHQPWTLSAEDVPVLRGLAAGLTHERAAIDAIIDAIQKHGEIRVWPEY